MHYNKYQAFLGNNTSRTVLNNELVINTIKSFNIRYNSDTIMTNDFATLYTKILHNKLLKVTYNLIDFSRNNSQVILYAYLSVMKD